MDSLVSGSPADTDVALGVDSDVGSGHGFRLRLGFSINDLHLESDFDLGAHLDSGLRTCLRVNFDSDLYLGLDPGTDTGIGMG